MLRVAVPPSERTSLAYMHTITLVRFKKKLWSWRLLALQIYANRKSSKMQLHTTPPDTSGMQHYLLEVFHDYTGTPKSIGCQTLKGSLPHGRLFFLNVVSAIQLCLFHLFGQHGRILKELDLQQRINFSTPSWTSFLSFTRHDLLLYTDVVVYFLRQTVCHFLLLCFFSYIRFSFVFLFYCVMYRLRPPMVTATRIILTSNVLIWNLHVSRWHHLGRWCRWLV